MPGENCCCIPLCTNSRRKKGLSFFKLPSEKKENRRAWRKRWLDQILKYREMDSQFKNQIKNDHVYTCEEHFHPHEIDSFQTKKSVIPEAIPTLKMPQKSHTCETTPRRSILRNPPTPDKASTEECSQQTPIYKSLTNVVEQIHGLKTLDSWEKTSSMEKLVIQKKSEKHLTTIPEFSIIVDDGLCFTIKIFGCFIPLDSEIYKRHKRSIRFVSIASLIKELIGYEICLGMSALGLSDLDVFSHVIPIENDDEDEGMFKHIKFTRSKKCLFLSKDTICTCCIYDEKILTRNYEKKQTHLAKPCKLKAPLSQTSHERVAAALIKNRLDCKMAKAELKELIEKGSSVAIDNQLNEDFSRIINNTEGVTDFMKLFWREQQDYLKKSNKKGVRYHPMLIRYCLSIHSKSTSAYEEIRNSGVLVLPSSRTLRDYKNFITPKPGFSAGIIDDLKKVTNEYFDVQRYIVLLFDEMKIKSNLVFDKHTHELKGFLDLGEDVDDNISTLGRETDTLASHALVFYLRGITTNLKYCFSYFATDGALSVQLAILFWDAVALLEFSCNLWVIAVTCDGASPNRNFFQIHRESNELCYKTQNVCAPFRDIFFFSDAPHLMKTARNCWANSGSGRCSRYMWNNNQFILWSHLTKIFFDDFHLQSTKVMPKITMQHVNLTPYSVMTVRYAAQVLSSTVAVVLRRWGGQEATETSQFCFLMDSFFDCFNTRSLKEADRKRKPFLAPYEKVDDERFDWLKNVFLAYFHNWNENIDKRAGDFNKAEREKMFISHQTFKGLIISCNSLIDCVRFLLNDGVEYVLSERFCQDVLEEYFGNQRKLGKRNDNPDIEQFGHNANTLRIQREVSRISGNTRGRYNNKRSWESVSDEIIPKRNPNCK